MGLATEPTETFEFFLKELSTLAQSVAKQLLAQPFGHSLQIRSDIVKRNYDKLSLNSTCIHKTNSRRETEDGENDHVVQLFR